MATPTSLPATFVAGNVLTAAQMNDLRGAFRILQVVETKHNSVVSTTSGTYVTTGLSASITPSSTSSKIAVFVSSILWSPTASTELALKIDRSTANIYENFPVRSDANSYGVTWSATVLDEPATTSALTYTVQFARLSGAGTIYAQVNSSASGIILMEVSA